MILAKLSMPKKDRKLHTKFVVTQKVESEGVQRELGPEKGLCVTVTLLPESFRLCHCFPYKA